MDSVLNTGESDRAAPARTAASLDVILPLRSPHGSQHGSPRKETYIVCAGLLITYLMAMLPRICSRCSMPLLLPYTLHGYRWPECSLFHPSVRRRIKIRFSLRLFISGTLSRCPSSLRPVQEF